MSNQMTKRAAKAMSDYMTSIVKEMPATDNSFCTTILGYRLQAIVYTCTAYTRAYGLEPVACCPGAPKVGQNNGLPATIDVVYLESDGGFPHCREESRR